MDYEERLIRVPGLCAGVPMPTVLWLTHDTRQQLPSRISDPDKRSAEGRIASWLKIAGRGSEGGDKRRIVQIAEARLELLQMVSETLLQILRTQIEPAIFLMRSFRSQELHGAAQLQF